MKKRLLLLWSAVLILASLFLAAAIGCGGGGTDPATAINNAIQNMNNVKSGHADLNVSLNVNGDLSALGAQYKNLLPLSLTIDSGVDFDSHDQNNPKAQGNLKIGGLDKVFSTLGQSQGADAQTQLGLGMISSALQNLQFVLLDQNLYLNIAGNWYQTGNLQSLGSQLPGGLAGDLSGGMSGMSTSGPTDTTSTSESTSTASAAESCITNALKDTNKFGAGQVLTNLQDMGTESIDGTNTHHYKGDVNFDSLLTQVANTSRDCGDAQAAGGIEAAKGQIGSVFKTASVEFWIGDDNNVHQAKVNLELDPSAIANLVGALGGTSTTESGSAASTTGTEALKGINSVSLNATVKMSNINGSVNISKPQGNIQNLQDLLGSGLGMMGGSGGSGLGLGGSTGTSTGDGGSANTST